MARDTLLFFVKLSHGKNISEVEEALRRIGFSFGREITGVCDLVVERQGERDWLQKSVEVYRSQIAVIDGIKSVTFHIRRSYHDAQ